MPYLSMLREYPYYLEQCLDPSSYRLHNFQKEVSSTLMRESGRNRPRCILERCYADAMSLAF